MPNQDNDELEFTDNQSEIETNCAVETDPLDNTNMNLRNNKLNLLYIINIFLQISIIFYLLTICVTCYLSEWQFFTWHPLLSAIAWLFLANQGILSFSNHNSLTRKLSRNKRVFLHWLIQGSATILLLTGFVIVFLNKDRLGKYHFTTWHGLFGLISVIGCACANLSGTLALYSTSLRNYVKPIYSKFLHSIGGSLVYTLGNFTVFLSLYSKWLGKNANIDLIFVPGVILIIFITSIVLIRPFTSVQNYIVRIYKSNKK